MKYALFVIFEKAAKFEIVVCCKFYSGALWVKPCKDAKIYLKLEPSYKDASVECGKNGAILICLDDGSYSYRNRYTQMFYFTTFPQIKEAKHNQYT